MEYASEFASHIHPSTARSGMASVSVQRFTLKITFCAMAMANDTFSFRVTATEWVQLIFTLLQLEPVSLLSRSRFLGCRSRFLGCRSRQQFDLNHHPRHHRCLCQLRAVEKRPDSMIPREANKSVWTFYFSRSLNFIRLEICWSLLNTHVRCSNYAERARSDKRNRREKKMCRTQRKQRRIARNVFFLPPLNMARKLQFSSM